MNIFSDAQEVDLGDVMAESVAREINIIDDDKLDAYLRAIGDRLVQHLPPTQMKFRFYLVELPEVNAFSIAGGRVYVARKMVAMTKSDDELAGVLAHELGHIVTHQTAIEITRRLREVLGVRQVEDRADVFEKFHLLLESLGRKPGHGGGEEEDKQYVADQVALYAMARAGYAPHAYIDFWDRFQQTHGKTGNWMSNLFGTTKPSERRLGVMLKNISALPPGCADIPPGSRTGEFAAWQAEVIGYSGFGARESLPGLVFKQTLALPLRPEITNLRFSPNGKYLLSQDEGGIHVLTRDPLAVLFYIDAVDAYEARFTPDSRAIVFHTRSLRVEIWSVADQMRIAAYELTVLHSCVQSLLSPDGLTLGCLDSEFNLSLIDVRSSSILVGKRYFVPMDSLSVCAVEVTLANRGDPQLITMNFSPDGHYFVAGSRATDFAWDLSAHRELSLPGSIREIVRQNFAFLGADRIVGIDLGSPQKSPLLRFPSGERLQQIVLANGIAMRPATRGDYLFVGPLKKHPLGLYDLRTGTMLIEFNRPVGDVYDETMVSEQVQGQIALHALDKISQSAAPSAVVQLPQGRLGSLRAAAVSSDFNWMAISHSTRGAVWDVTHNIRTMELSSFHGAWFAPDQSVYVDLAKFMETERTIGRLDPVSGKGTLGYKIGDGVTTQYGPYLLGIKSRAGKTKEGISLTPAQYCFEAMAQNLRNGGKRDDDVEIRDVRDGHVLWSHYFPHEVPDLSLSWGKIMLRWSLNSKAGREELGKYPELKGGTSETDYLLEVIDLQKDSVVGKLVIRTNKGSFAVNRALSLGDWVIASATGNQVITYSLSSGQEKGHFFGTYPIPSWTGLLALENEAGELNIYDMGNSQLKRHYAFADAISFKTFSPDGSRIFVVTSSQTAYVLNINEKN